MNDMKVAIITDQHFGARNDSIQFLDYYEKFYTNIFFPILKKNKIKMVLILGDTFDRRKFINYYSLHRAKEMFFDKLQENKISVHMIVGNHDVTYKNTNSINSANLLLSDYKNITVIENPTTIKIDDIDICMIPWICEENYDESLKTLENTPAQICMGHFEITGFLMYRDAPMIDGMSPELFKKFDMVFSGHYHHKSSKNNIHYLGNPNELTWQDYDDPRGFHLFDLSTRELEFIQNPYRMFYKIVYDDKDDDIQKLIDSDLSIYGNTYVKVIVINKTNPYLFDMFIAKLQAHNPLDIAIAEDIVGLDDKLAEDTVNEAEDTISILNTYVESLDTDLDKMKIKTLFQELYVEALNAENQTA